MKNVQTTRQDIPKNKRINRLRRCTSLRKDVRGLAGIEFALIGGFLAFTVLNLTDISVFCLDQLQLQNGTQMGAQAAWQTCDLNHIPAKTNCPSLTNAVKTAVQSSTLGTNVTLQAGYPSEGYYCVNTTGALQLVGAITSPPPNNCTAAGNAATVPADYVLVQTNYTYKPIFPGISIATLLPTQLSATSYVRLG
jgi:Flp pilus assembly protein TadG